MVSPLGCLLVGNTRLLQNVGLDVTAGQLAQGVEVDFDELALGTQSYMSKRSILVLCKLSQILRYLDLDRSAMLAPISHSRHVNIIIQNVQIV